MAARRQHELLRSGSPLPDLRLAQLENGERSLVELAARGPVLLVFFKVTCPVCQFTLPFLERIHAGALPVCAISQNDAEDTREFNREFRLSLPTLLDDEESGFPVSNAFGISTVPVMFLVERDRTVSQVFEGWRKKDMEWLGARAGIQLFRPGDYVPEWKAG